ncbi:cation diffusion facilitator CzcD-associated flavoprotein CzcO [Isoptericola jiangsuensis]|uniref:Cation diffusion facilitator CzcD-associated flavoprotein CzcO n=1 Tax=Isoptericola jiangsuensis TaxID=548579 RepID=A0A2A9EU30_9MICO|nr:FAD-dependent oxidoreductase [Isoptericola jiangsuensis]PFG41735.1 cation diffusion facilitator CzcD-associated flavoprotein CzcO [Isoptericola jiangsuensis]
MGAVARDDLPVVVIGAGPVGLAAAAHLLERGLDPLVLEAGDGPGAAVASWGHVRLFSPWRYDVDAAARRLLEPTGWTMPDPEALPTGAELVDDYLAPLAATPPIASRLRTGTRVLAVARDGADRTRSLGRSRRPYRVRTVDAAGRVTDVLARAVLDASGTYGTPNPLGTSGLPASGEAEAAAWTTGPLPDVLGADRARFAGRRTVVVGMGHSAANTLLSLVELAREAPGTTITWAIRGGSPRRLYGGGADDELPARGLLGTRLRDAVDAGLVRLATRVSIDRLVPGPDGVVVVGTAKYAPFEVEVDAIVDATGFRPDLDMLREVRLDLDPVVEAPRALAPLIDPNQHSCGTVPPHGEQVLAHPDDGFYLVGMKSYGRAPTFLLATGYEQVRSVAAALAGDRTAADAVELDLPATGVCSSDLAPEADGESSAGSCCGTAPAEPQLVTLGVGAPSGVGFASGVPHGRSGDGEDA